MQQTKDKETQIQEMFDRIASIYDLMNHLMTAGLDRRWRSRVADLTNLQPGDTALDVACGTGDLANELAKRVGQDGAVVGSDFSEQMISIAKQKFPRLNFEIANALELPFDDNSFDATTVGFGVRNFSDPLQGIKEMVRVTKPSGRVVILEITNPTRPPLSWFFNFWFDTVIPRFGKLFFDPSAYVYLPESVKNFSTPQQLAELMKKSGLEDIRYIVTGGGIITIHAGNVPG